ncbi:GcvT family protein [Pseudooctadecabacter jejudonensis]|uniref:4-methylaminobutanoate oxidase (Formaldehyde-forming) n=1 Tax=Pseudooctadecabacter jejudonensis TaxID=1391910 RepID=A0A1Y5S9S7_9RHOB|nr:FAD-dependent oxidoreductase [Pseudooctadecabacter jejudonensis]SLN35830.1 4-methylaminobutanoate oxidase (formaldehyde-forming) [Pseudooctadecabacter jejudonensis]
MADFPTTARVVIIGGGVVGTSTLFHLARAGWTDCVLLEKNELTAGSTWHAAGNCPNFAPNWAVMNMQRFGLELYRGLAEDVDYPMNYHVTGSVRLAHSKQRMEEFKRAKGQAKAQGLDLEILTPEELREYNPFMEIHDLEGGMWDSLDGDIDPAQLTQALAKGARDAGARIERFCPVTGVDRDGDEWVIKTEKGDIRCEFVVNAAGYYAQRVGEMFKPHGGRTVPMVVMSHQYFLTGQLPELEAWTKEQGHKMPMIRDPDISYYLRQDKYGLNLGPYERNCKAHWVTPEDPMPEDFSFQLYPDDLERLEFYIEDAMARVPLLGEGGVERNINGPIPYAPDGLPMIGPMPGVKNAFEAHSFTFGIAQGGGAGKVLSEWIMHGETELDMWSVDPRRYTDYADHDYCLSKALETYGHEYAMHFPHHEWPAGRDKKHSTLHSRLAEAGAQFGAYNGWERANWFAKDGEDTSEDSTQTWDRNGPWEPAIKREVEAVRDGCGMLPITGFSRYKIEGPGAKDFVDSLTASRLPKPGRVSLAYFPDSRGRILTETSVMVHSDDEVGLITAATAQWHDYEIFWRQAPEGITVTDHTTEVETLLVTGPKARDMLAPITEGHDLSASWLSLSMKGTVAGQDCALLRVSFAGELGWEIHAAPEAMPAIWDALLAAGVTPFGMYALNSMRIEKGYRAWKGDLSTDYSLLEGGLDRFVKLDKDVDFPGKAALLNEQQQGRKKGFATMVMEPGHQDAPYMAPVWSNGSIVGEVTSCAMGYRTNQCIALGMVQTDYLAEGTELEIDVNGTRRRAVVQKDAPMWDPENMRIRG